MMFAGMKIPKRLQRHVANLSSTVQVLLSEVILAVEGYEAEANRSTAKALKRASSTKKSTELLADQLRQFLNDSTADDMAIAVAASAGRSTRQIAEFFDMEQKHVMRRLHEIRKVAATAKPEAEAPAEHQPKQAEVLELFTDVGYMPHRKLERFLP